MPYIHRFKSLAEQALKHIQTNATIYLNLIGAVEQNDFATAITCLKVLTLRVVIGGIRNRLKMRRKDDDDKTNK